MSVESTKACLDEIASTLPAKDFDTVVVIMLDRTKSELSNWWYFAGHPDDWGSQELSSIAQQMTAFSAETMKEDVNVNQRPIRVKTKTVRTGAVEIGRWLSLFTIGIPLSPTTDAYDRLWLTLEIYQWEFGLNMRWFQDKGYWSITFLIGPISFRIARTWK